jgi:hypothetical protein
MNMTKFLVLGMTVGLLTSAVPSFSESVTYTPYSSTSCDKGRCTVSLGQHFVYENSQWILADQAKSLMGKEGFGVSYLKIDPDYTVTVQDFNWTFMTVKLQAGNLATASNVPLKVWTPNASKTSLTGDFKKDGILKGNFSVGFASKSDIRTQIIPATIGDVIEFGHNSTLITLNESNYGNIGDSRVVAGTSVNYNFGIATGLNIVNSGISQWSYIYWNISYIPSGSTIINSNMSLYMNSQGSSNKQLLAFNTSVYNSSGAGPWYEGTLNNAVCSGDGLLLSRNITWSNKPLGDQLQDSVSSKTGSNYWIYWNITNSTISSFSNTKNMSIMINITDATSATFYSKEFATVNLRPQLNITYEEVTTTTSTTSTTTSSTSSSTTTSTTSTSSTTTTIEATTTTLPPFGNVSDCCPCGLGSLLVKSCLNDSTEQGTLIYDNLTYQSQRTCTYGCDSVSGCKPAPFFTDLATLGLFFGMIVVFAFIVWVVRKI